MSKAELYTDEDGDLVVVLCSPDGSPHERARVSEMGKPCKDGHRGAFDRELDGDLAFLDSISGDLAMLYIEHGCNLAEYELDQAIWAAEYVHQMSFAMTKDFAREASKAADYIVRSRWLAKGK